MAKDDDIGARLDPAVAAQIRRAIARGEYASEDDILREAMDLWLADRFDRQEWVRHAIQKGVDDIEAGRVRRVDEAFWRELWAEAERRRTHQE